jgi:hypothetical protein
VNWADDGPRWGDYVAQDVRCHVDATYRTQPDAAHRAIGGLSMGGSGALQLAFNHPDLFQIVGAHSPSPHLDDGTFSLIYGTGSDFEEREPIDLAANAPGIDSLHVWVDAGEDDPWLPRDELIHENLLERGIAHGWDVLPGGHDGSYWTRNLPMYLHYYDRMLHGPAPTVRLALATDPVDAPALALPDVDSPMEVLALPDVDSPILAPDLDGPTDVSDDDAVLDPGDLPADPLQSDDSDWTPDGDPSGVAVFSLGIGGASAS